MPTVSLTTPTDYQTQAAEIERRRKYAELLAQQSMQPEQQQTAGGMTVPTSWTQHAAKLLQGYMGGVGQRQASTDTQALAAVLRGQRQADIQQFQKMRDGAPEAYGGSQGGPDADLSGMDSTYSPAMAANPKGANAFLASSLDPSLSQIGLAELLKPPKAPIKAELGGQTVFLDPDTLKPVASFDMTAKPDTVLREAGEDRRHVAASGSAILGSQTTLQTHATPSGSAVLGAETARRGQDIGATTARRGQDITLRGQNLGIDPAVQSAIAQAKASGKEFGEAGAQAQINLPTAVAKGQQALDLVNQMIGGLTVDKNGNLALPKGAAKPHPGFSVGVGASAQPGFQYIPGTDKAGFYALLDQVKGGAFLQAFEQLKGGGQITEVEGKKATDAITRMNTAQSEAEFVKAAREFQDVIKAGVGRAQQKANPGRRTTDQPGAVIDFNDL